MRAAGLGTAIIACYLALVLASGRVDPADFGLLFLFYLRTAASLWLIVGLGGLLWLLWTGRPRAGEPARPLAMVADWLRSRWARDRLVSLLWPPLAVRDLDRLVQRLQADHPAAAGFRFDPLFAEMDRWLFLGIDPWRISHGLFGSPTATLIFDRAYHAWFVPMALGLMICAWLPSASFRLRTQYLLSYIMMWIGVGSVLAFLLPAAGPCFYETFAGPSPTFQAMMAKLAADQAALAAPVSALTFQDALLGVFGNESLAVGGGISAMPSVHNGLAALFALAAFRINRKAGWVMTFYAAAIWIGSIHLGWHYAIDGFAAFALAWGIWRVAGRIALLAGAARQRPGAGPGARLTGRRGAARSVSC